MTGLRQDFEGTEHDGDVEDYSDNESTEPEQLEKLMYYPQNEETSSDYTVNAMDVEELRRSQRRLKKPRPPPSPASSPHPKGCPRAMHTPPKACPMARNHLWCAP